MRKIRIFENISLDGVIEHDTDYAFGTWTTPYRTPDGLTMLLEVYGATFDMILGRRTYDNWSGFWPKAGDNPMANRINAATKYIATHRPDSLEWGPVKDLGTDIIAGIKAIKSTEGPDLIVCGSATLTSLLLDTGLVDEVILSVYPLLLGRGKRIFSEGFDARKLQFISSKTTPTGVQINSYKHIGSIKGQTP